MPLIKIQTVKVNVVTDYIGKGTEALVNTDHIVMVHEAKDRICRTITMSNGATVNTESSIEDIEAMIRKARN